MTKLIKLFPPHKGQRIDALLASLLELSRGEIQKAIDQDLVLVNNKPVKSSYRVSGNEEVSYTALEVDTSDIKPYEFKLDIVFEDEYLLVINKPAGLVVHPSFGHNDDTLVNALVASKRHLSDINGSFRPGIVHRIDKDTSGLLIVCKNNDVHAKMAELLKNHEVRRTYFALVKGTLKEDAGKIKSYLGRSSTNYQKRTASGDEGKLAITHFEVIERFTGYMLLKLNLETGRTHQIRSHMELLNTPVVGDKLYGKNNNDIYSEGQLLHAGEIAFIHPITKEKIELTSPLPSYFEATLKKLRTSL